MTPEQNRLILDHVAKNEYYQAMNTLMFVVREQDKKIEELENKIARLDGENSLNRPLGPSQLNRDATRFHNDITNL